MSVDVFPHSAFCSSSGFPLFYSPFVETRSIFLPHFIILLFFIIIPAVPEHFCTSILWVTASAWNLILLHFAGRYVLFLIPVLNFSAAASLRVTARASYSSQQKKQKINL